MDKQKKAILLNLPADMHAEIKELAYQERTPLTVLIRKLIADKVKRAAKKNAA